MTNPAVQYQKVFKPGSQNDMSLSVKFLVLMTKFHIRHPTSEARRFWFRAHPPLSLFAMPQGQMLTTLKGIAETLLSLLTLLPSGDDASERGQSCLGIGRRESSSIRDSSHDEQYDAGASLPKEPLARNDESTKPSLTFRGCKWTPNWTSFLASRRSCTSRTTSDKTTSRDYVPWVLAGAGERGDSVGKTVGGRSDSQLQSMSWTAFPNGGFSKSSNNGTSSSLSRGRI